MNESFEDILELTERSIAQFLANDLVIQLRRNDTPILTEVAADFMTRIEGLERVLLLLQVRSKPDGRAKIIPMPSGSRFQ